jgi:hypothetical protein
MVYYVTGQRTRKLPFSNGSNIPCWRISLILKSPFGDLVVALCVCCVWVCAWKWRCCALPLWTSQLLAVVVVVAVAVAVVVVVIVVV